jgi:hypothetical protein
MVHLISNAFFNICKDFFIFLKSISALIAEKEWHEKHSNGMRKWKLKKIENVIVKEDDTQKKIDENMKS